jgi:hypothetical protein
MTAYQIGDPVVDLAQGRPMVVVDAPTQSVQEWSEANGYDLQDNYANSKFDPQPEEGVVECVYVSDVRSEPSKTYTFPVSRVALIDVHHADDGRRIAERVQVSLLTEMFVLAIEFDEGPTPGQLETLARSAGVETDAVEAARETAEAATLTAPEGED